MTTEQKAKAYDETISKLQSLITNANKQGHIIIRVEDLENSFPKLKESEDDRIRKDIIRVLKGEISFTSEKENEKYIAWLEKQDEKDKLIKVLSEYKVKYIQETLEKYVNSMSNKDDERLRKTTIAFLKEFADKGYENVECIDWLEKQGEKPQGKSALEAAKEEKVDNQNCANPTNNPEPNFYEGDWIVSNYNKNIFLIKGTTLEYFILEDVNGNIYSRCLPPTEDDYHLWTIQDAKDGDVLVASDGSIFLFAGVVDCACKYYAVLTTFNEVKIKKEVYDSGYWETSRAVHPSTKEQRDALFTKIKEAGYEWDADKKELKKIEDEPKNYKQQVMSEITDLVEDYIRQKPVKWTEEDEQHINSLLKRLDGLCRNEFERTRFAISEDRAWLKSLKERIGG